MTVENANAAAFATPSTERLAFLRRVGVWSFLGLAVTAVVSVVAMFTVVPTIMSFPFGSIAGILLPFFFANIVCRKMVYGEMKIPGFLLACIAEGFAFGFLLLYTIFLANPDNIGEGMLIVAEGMGITAAAGFGMMMYTIFNKSDLSLVKAGLSIVSLPMLLLMGLQFVFPIGGVFGLVLISLFVIVSAAALLYALHSVVHEMEEDMHMEGAFEITMKILLLLWNVISLLNRVRR